ncbi:21.9 kda heat shock protein [Anaeramoeba ignava]|uniref:21.9 kDa heat shock protein n=1 Tax=Anaeramoeba ignava TaxID=1746090 RepID=A0A9Q0L928_ANAIG|nr:21.9 kda heat shock protein [Anaeramoeba ignava]
MKRIYLNENENEKDFIIERKEKQYKFPKLILIMRSELYRGMFLSVTKKILLIKLQIIKNKIICTTWGIKETEKEIQISGKIHIPKESINIEFDKESRMLSIFGEHEVKKEEKEDEKEKRVRCERSYSSFKQSFKLPELAEIEKSDASFEDGFLSITIPKKEEEKKEEKTKLSINFK